MGGKLFKSKFKSQTDHPGGGVGGLVGGRLVKSDLYPTLALIRAQLGFKIKVEADRLIIRVGGRLVKTDFITHSGSHQSSAWIQNPSWSRVWQYGKKIICHKKVVSKKLFDQKIL